MKARWLSIGRLFEQQKNGGEPGEPGEPGQGPRHQLVQLELFLWPWVPGPGPAQPQPQTGPAKC